MAKRVVIQRRPRAVKRPSVPLISATEGVPVSPIFDPAALEAATKAELAKVKADKPSSFTVGGTFDGHKVTGGIEYQRKWSNGWGATAFARAWWDDAPITPTDKFGVVAGGEVTKTF